MSLTQDNHPLLRRMEAAKGRTKSRSSSAHPQHRARVSKPLPARIVAVVASAAMVVLTVLVAPAALAASGSISSVQNLSNNPIAATNLAGYSIQSGGSKLTRVSVTDHVIAKWAARVTSRGTTTRIREPREPVKGGETWSFASDVKASRVGATAQITVSWYNGSGGWLSWSGGTSVPVSAGNWTRVAASLKVPAGATVAETVVNVHKTADSSTATVTQHDVRAPTASETPTPTPTPTPTSTTPSDSSMEPPAGATLVRDLSRASYWTPENGGSLNELAEKGPGNEPVLRSTLVDGQTGAGSAAPNERNDLQGGTVPQGSIRWMTWHERFVQMPTTNLDRWQLIGPNEIHGSTLPQATVMPEVGPDKRRRLNANAGRSTTRYFDLGPIVLGEWHQYKFGVHYTQGSNGWLELWKDGVRVLRVEGPTTTESNNGYWKFGHYRNADINGTSIYDVSGTRIYGQ